MSQGVLNGLRSSDLQAIASAISGARALRQFLATRGEVHAVTEALSTGTLAEPTVRAFTERLLADLKRGEAFPHDLTLAALAVALGERPTPFADEYLEGLAHLEAAEMPYGPHVAREVLSGRRTLTRPGPSVAETPEHTPREQSPSSA